MLKNISKPHTYAIVCIITISLVKYITKRQSELDSTHNNPVICYP